MPRLMQCRLADRETLDGAIVSDNNKEEKTFHYIAYRRCRK